MDLNGMPLYFKASLTIALMISLLAACSSSTVPIDVETAGSISPKTNVSDNVAVSNASFDGLEAGVESTPAIKVAANKTASVALGKSKPYVKIKGIGYGVTVSQSRRDALDNLVSSIQIDVLKEVRICTNDFGDCGSIVRVNTQSELPILGGQFKRLGNTQDNVRFLAWVDSNNALPMYIRDLDRLEMRIEKSIAKLKTLKSPNQRYRVIRELLGFIAQYDKKRLVANVLGGYEKKSRPEVSIHRLKDELKQLEKKANSLSFAA